MIRTRVKICGMTREEDVRLAVQLGVDAIGVIFAPSSPRFISVLAAQELRELIPPLVSMVGVFVDGAPNEVNSVAKQVGLDLVQLHGDEDAKFAAQLELPYIKAVRLKSAQQLSEQMQVHNKARAFLLDPYVKGQHGGTGQQLDETLWPEQVAEFQSPPLILAGGLKPTNVRESIRKLKPYAIDLSSGVESSPGKKSSSKMKALFAEIA